MILEILIGIMIGGTIAAIVSFAVGINVFRPSRVALVTAYDIECQALVDKCVDTGLCDRALIIKMHNGGGRIVAGKPKYASVLFEANSNKVQSIRDTFQHYEVDVEYSLLIQRVQFDRRVIQETMTMPHSMLRRRYENDKLTASFVPFFIETKGGMYYGSFSTVGPAHEFLGSSKFSEMESIINRIKNVHRRAKAHRFLD